MRLAATGVVVGTMLVIAPALADESAKRQLPSDAGWALRLPKDDKVAYRGIPDFRGVGAGEHRMVYGPGPVIALAMLAGQAVYVDATLARQRDEAQERADRVLMPYLPMLNSYTNRELMQRAVANLQSAGRPRLLDSGQSGGTDWVFDTGMVILMTPDELGLVLEAAFALRSPGAPDKAAYERMVRVISRPKDPDTVRASWSADNGDSLKEEGALLLAHAIELIVRDATGDLAKARGAQRTYRYPEGGKERVERAELVAEFCRRVVVQNLRDWLVSIPQEGSTTACAR